MLLSPVTVNDKKRPVKLRKDESSANALFPEGWSFSRQKPILRRSHGHELNHADVFQWYSTYASHPPSSTFAELDLVKK